MIRLNRSRVIGLFAACLFLYFIFSHSESDTTFRHNTEAGLARKEHLTKQGKEYMSDAAETSQLEKELLAILDQQHNMQPGYLAPENVGEVVPTAEAESQGVRGSLKGLGNPEKGSTAYEDVSVAGRKTMQKLKEVGGKDQPKYPQNPDVGPGEEKAYNGAKIEKVVDLAKEAARAELQQILKRSPVVIFSKSHCPYSKRAKEFLQQTYDIRPAPYVVELDLLTEEAPRDENSDEPSMTQGRALQNLLGEITGRKTVPNILVATHSIGGCSEVEQMDRDGTLTTEIRKLAGVRVQIGRRGGGSGSSDD